MLVIKCYRRCVISFGRLPFALSNEQEEKELTINEGIEFGKLVNYDKIISDFCYNQWRDDHKMVLHCIEEQKDALSKLNEGKPNDIDEADFIKIRQDAELEYPNDFCMQLFCQEEQINALRKLKKIFGNKK